MNLLKNLILFFLIIFFNSCSVEDGKVKAPFWVVSGGNTISYKDDFREWEDVTITSDAILTRDFESNNSQGLIAVGQDGNIWQSSDKGLSWDNNIDTRIKLSSSFSDILPKYNYSQNNDIENHYPSVVGLHLRDAIYFLETLGYAVIIKGDLGSVKKQYPKPNTQIKNNLAITLFT